MKMRGSVSGTLIGLLAVSGCASNWNLHGAPPDKVAQDRYRCTQESKTSFSGGGTGYYGLGAILASGIAAKASAQQLFDLCMEAAGYTKINANIAQSPIVQPIPAVQYPAPTSPTSQPAPQWDPPTQTAMPPGAIQPTLYYSPYPGATPVPVPPPSGPVEPEFTVRGDAPRVASAPAVATGIKTESTYMLTAEQLAKAQGCRSPAAAMTTKGSGQESFVVACPNGNTMAMLCGVDGCRILR